MQKLRTVLALAAGAVFLSGCAGMMLHTPAGGLLFTEVYGPIDAGGRVGAKEGRACAKSILGLVATGDASIKAAAAAGGITQINSVDHYTRNMLGIMGDFCTIVRGS
jgi:hypothetical protein